jgi:hypothetical protein
VPLSNNVPSGSPVHDAQAVVSDGVDAHRSLRIFREQIASYFPFVVVPDESPKQIAKEYPFCWRVIVMITTTEARHQAELGKGVMNELVTSLLLEGKKNLDILQGLLLFTAWFVCGQNLSRGPQRHF